MEISNVLVTNVNITEDEYTYSAGLVLSCGGQTLQMELSDLDSGDKLEEIKAAFQLSETPKEIRQFIFDVVMEKSGLASRNAQGEHYEAETGHKAEKAAKELDMA